MGLCDDVRAPLRAVVAAAPSVVAIDEERLGAVEPGPPPALDPSATTSRARREDVAAYLLTLDAINFGSGWFPTLRKRAGCSGYFTVAWALADHFRAHGPWSNRRAARADGPPRSRRALGQDPRSS